MLEEVKIGVFSFFHTLAGISDPPPVFASVLSYHPKLDKFVVARAG
jgi:hypothetical protein